MVGNSSSRLNNQRNVISPPERWIKKRYGLLLLLTLFLWPFLAWIPQFESIAVNALLLDNYQQLAYLTVTNVVAYFFATSIMRVLGTRNPGGRVTTFVFGDGKAPWGWKRVLGVTLISSFAPLFVGLTFTSEFPSKDTSHIVTSISVVFGSALATVVGLWALGFVKCWIFGSEKDSSNYFPFESRSENGLNLIIKASEQFEGILLRIGLESTDFQFAAYLFLLAITHYQVSKAFEANYLLASAPSMLVVVIWLALFTLAGLANWLDRWRIPTLLVFVLLSAMLLFLRGSTKLLVTVPDTSENKFVSRVADIYEEETKLLDENNNRDIHARRRALIACKSKPLDEDAWTAITKRMDNLNNQPQYKKGKTVVVVTCPGGGIHAAAWASCVLDQISNEYVEFKDSVCVISGVSGGSVGTLLFVGSRYEEDLLDKKRSTNSREATNAVSQDFKTRSPALELSSRSALEAIAFGATVDDLYNLIGFDGKGRGQRLEDSLTSRLPFEVRSMTIGQWGDRSMAGRVPIVIFNSTDAITGRRVLFDTIPTPIRLSSVGLKARPLNYRELLNTTQGLFDLLPATAARTSATFPYISPFTKPSNANDMGDHVALCDGGYVDNEGIVTAANWIEFLLRQRKSSGQNEKVFDRILLLRIQPSWIDDKNEPSSSGGLLGFFRWLAGPAEAMVNVRSASQLERGNLETDLAELSAVVDRKNGPSSPGDLLGYFRLFAAPALAAVNVRSASQVEHGNPEADLADQSVVVDKEDDTASSMNAPPPLTEKTDTGESITRKYQKLKELAKRNLSKSTRQKIWEEVLDTFKKEESSSPVTSGSVTSSPTKTEKEEQIKDESLIIVQTIPFVNNGQTIPLNWKLSEQQKIGYLLAWVYCSHEGTPLRKTLDSFFTRK